MSLFSGCFFKIFFFIISTIWLWCSLELFSLYLFCLDLSSLDLWVYNFHQIWKNFSYYFFRCFSVSLSSQISFPSKTPWVLHCWYCLTGHWCSVHFILSSVWASFRWFRMWCLYIYFWGSYSVVNLIHCICNFRWYVLISRCLLFCISFLWSSCLSPSTSWARGTYLS